MFSSNLIVSIDDHSESYNENSTITLTSQGNDSDVVEVITITPPKKVGGSMGWLLAIVTLLRARRYRPINYP
ncbi:MAG: hypothetical protein JKY19_09215 [Alcanivoracaceae bacterium]|nr:hypothetical protein [Alcanivoracaceae bacterium]